LPPSVIAARILLCDNGVWRAKKNRGSERVKAAEGFALSGYFPFVT